MTREQAMALVKLLEIAISQQHYKGQRLRGQLDDVIAPLREMIIDAMVRKP